MKLVCVVEAWGRREHQFQHPLVGPSGRELTLEMGKANLAPYMRILCRICKLETDFIDGFCPKCSNRIWPNEFDLIAHWKHLRTNHDIAITNVFNVQPPGNDLGHFFGTEPETPMPAWKASRKIGGSHLKREYFFHVERLWRELEDLKPNLILCLGNASCWAVLGQTKITALRGTVLWSDKLNTKVLPTFHPAAVLRQWRLRATTIADFQKATREVEFPEIRRPQRWLTVPTPDENGLTEIANWLKRPALAYANDIETIRHQISIVGFALSSSDALVVPFRDGKMEKGQLVDVGKIAAMLGRLNNGINFWPTPELEYKAWKLTIAGVESSVSKIYQNGLFDISYFMRMGIHPRRADHDTMLWHHSQYPELPKSLGYLGSVYANEIAWKQMAHGDSFKRDE